MLPVVAMPSFLTYFLGRRKASARCFPRRLTLRVHCFVGAPTPRLRELDRIVIWIHPSLFGVIAFSYSGCLFRDTPEITYEGCPVFVVCSAHFDPRNVRNDSPEIPFVDIRLSVMFACGRRSSGVGTRVAVVQVAEAPSERCCGTELPGVHKCRL